MFKYNTMNMKFNKYFSIAKREVKQAIIDNKRLILLMVGIYVISIIISGIFSSQIMGAFTHQFNAMGDETSTLDPALDLFIHNEFGGIQTYIYSIFFGIYAFFSLITNGMMIGVTFGEALAKGPVYGICLFIGFVAPHGIFEIPATILESVAGVLLFLFIFRFFKTIRSIDGSSFKLKAKDSWEVNKIYFKQSIVLMIFCCCLLVIAAIIEGHITDYIGYWIKSFF